GGPAAGIVTAACPACAAAGSTAEELSEPEPKEPNDEPVLDEPPDEGLRDEPDEADAPRPPPPTGETPAMGPGVDAAGARTGGALGTGAPAIDSEGMVAGLGDGAGASDASRTWYSCSPSESGSSAGCDTSASGSSTGVRCQTPWSPAASGSFAKAGSSAFLRTNTICSSCIPASSPTGGISPLAPGVSAGTPR